MFHRALVVALVFAAVACGSMGNDSPEPPRSFPIFEGGKFGFINTSGNVVVNPEYKYWGPLPVGGGAAPAEGPNGSRISGEVTVSGSAFGTMATSTGTPSRFWLLDGADAAMSVTIRASSRAFSPAVQLFEFRDGSWQQVNASNYGSLVHYNSGSARYPLGVRVTTRTYFYYSYPTRWVGGPFSLSLELNGKRPTSLDFLSELRFIEGRMPYRVGDKWGFLAEDGTIAINPRFDAVTAFADGLAGVRVEDRWGFVDREGTIRIQPAYDAVGQFGDGLAAAFIGERCGYIDNEGQFVINPSYSDCLNFRDRVAMVRDDARWGAIDEEGKTLFVPQFEAMTEFYNDQAGVLMGNKWGLVDRTGRITLPPQFDELLEPTEGTLWMVKVGGRYGYIDPEGKFIVGPTLDEAHAFSDGFARVRMGDRWGFIQPDGKYLGGAGPTYDEVRPMSNGRAAVRMEDRWGFIDDKGFMIVTPTYDTAGDFDGDLAAVFKDGMLGYINRSGKVVRSPSSGATAAASAGATAPAAPAAQSIEAGAAGVAPAPPFRGETAAAPLASQSSAAATLPGPGTAGEAGAGGQTGNDGSSADGPPSRAGVGSSAGSEIFPPILTSSFMLPLPVPNRVRPYKLVAQFEVDETGNARLLAFNPSRDSNYTQKIRETLGELRFRPATRTDGTALKDTVYITAEMP